jgi:hypothetical protein
MLMHEPKRRKLLPYFLEHKLREREWRKIHHLPPVPRWYYKRSLNAVRVNVSYYQRQKFKDSVMP